MEEQHDDENRRPFKVRSIRLYGEDGCTVYLTRKYDLLDREVEAEGAAPPAELTDTWGWRVDEADGTELGRGEFDGAESSAEAVARGITAAQTKHIFGERVESVRRRPETS